MDFTLVDIFLPDIFLPDIFLPDFCLLEVRTSSIEKLLIDF